ncbi:MAG: YfhO family protein, partial [Rhodothermales bacterium]
QRRAEPSTPAPEWFGFWDAQSMVRRHAVMIGLLMLLAVAFFAPIHFSDGQLIATDTVQWRAMAESMLEMEEETGSVALWAGRVFAGMPGYMISPELSVPQVDVIMRELRLLIWPTSHMWLLLIGTYLLAFRVTKESLSAAVAAVAYGFTTYIPVILAAGHNSKYIALAWAPWMLLAFIHAMDRRTLVSALLFAIALAVNLRAGHVQITYYVTMAAGIWWLVEAVHAFRSGDRAAFFRGTGMLALGSVLGLMMVAQPYMSHAEITPYTIRGSASGGGAGGMGWEYAMAWSQGVGELMTLLVADAFGGASPTYWGAKTFTGGPHYFGMITIILMALAFWNVRDRATLSLSIAFLATILFALGENLALLNRPMFSFFPLFDAFRVPETWLSMSALLAALMAARGMASLRQAAEQRASLLARPVFRLVLGFGILLVILNVMGTTLFSFEKPGERTQIETQIERSNPGVSMADPRVQQFVDEQLAEITAQRIDVFSKDAFRSLFVIVLLGTLIYLLVQRRLPYWLVGILVLAIVVVDLTGVARRHVNEEALSPASDPSESVREFGFDRYLVAERERHGGEGAFRVLSLEFGQHPVQNARPSFFHESLGGYSGAKLRLYQDFLDHLLFGGSQGVNGAALDMMDVGYLVAAGGLPGFAPVFQDEETGQGVYRNHDRPGRAWLVDSVAVMPGHEAVWAAINEPGFDPASTALVTDTAALDAAALTGPSDSTWVETVSYTAEDMTFNVHTDRARLLVVSEVYYPPGWQATVDGQPATIHQVNHLLRGVVVPAGTHEVRMTFKPASYQRSFWITATGTGLTYGLLLLFGVLAWRRRNESNSPSEDSTTSSVGT